MSLLYILIVYVYILFLMLFIIHPVAIVYVLTCFIRYVYYCNLQFLSNVIDIKTNVMFRRHW